MFSWGQEGSSSMKSSFLHCVPLSLFLSCHRAELEGIVAIVILNLGTIKCVTLHCGNYH